LGLTLPEKGLIYNWGWGILSIQVHLAGLGQTVTFFALRGKKAASSPKPQMLALCTI
jgi:hypothetical protein